MLLLAIVVILIIAISVYIIISIIQSKASLQDLVPSLLVFNKSTPILNSDDTKSILLQSGGSSILALVNIQISDKTSQLNSQHIFKNIISVPNAFALQMAPAPISSTKQSMQLVVFVSNNETELHLQEIIELPPLPQQKWVLISILRDGRRFDVMYDDTIVASHRLSNYPVIIQNQLILGDAGITGQANHILVAPYRLSSYDVAKQRALLVDTNGAPITKNTIPFVIPTMQLQTTCIPGIPCNAITNPPSNHLQAWKSPYS